MPSSPRHFPAPWSVEEIKPAKTRKATEVARRLSRLLLDRAKTRSFQHGAGDLHDYGGWVVDTLAQQEKVNY